MRFLSISSSTKRRGSVAVAQGRTRVVVGGRTSIYAHGTWGESTETCARTAASLGGQWGLGKKLERLITKGMALGRLKPRKQN